MGATGAWGVDCLTAVAGLVDDAAVRRGVLAAGDESLVVLAGVAGVVTAVALLAEGLAAVTGAAVAVVVLPRVGDGADGTAGVVVLGNAAVGLTATWSGTVVVGDGLLASQAAKSKAASSRDARHPATWV